MAENHSKAVHRLYPCCVPGRSVATVLRPRRMSGPCRDQCIPQVGCPKLYDHIFSPSRKAYDFAIDLDREVSLRGRPGVLLAFDDFRLDTKRRELRRGIELIG